MARSDPIDGITQGVSAPPAIGKDAAAHRGLAHALAERVAAMTFRDLPHEAVEWAKVGILDTVGVTLAGSRSEAPRIVARSLDMAPGPALVFGEARRVGTLDAAFVNGTASHVLDFDDCNNTLGGHPSVPVLSALFPLADELGSNGADFVLAYVAGFEVETKLALAVNFHHYTKGWHPTATLGTFGAAAACAKLMGLDAHKTAVALALAASFASGIKANFGTMAKPMHVGHCARSGILAARLARNGFTANDEDVFEHEQGFLDVFNGRGTYDVQRALAAWAAPLDIIKPGIAIKQYPCCGSTHPAIDAMLELVEQRHIDPDDVARIDGWIHARRLKHTNRPDPDSPLDAKFSLQYVLARALIDGHVGVADFEGDSYRDARILALLPRVHVAPYDESRFPAANHFGGAVRLTMKDGSVHEAQVDQALGRTSDNPLPAKRLHAKFALNAAAAIRADLIDPIAQTIAALDTLADLRTLSKLIQAGAVTQESLN